jgi:hypothetical protein
MLIKTLLTAVAAGSLMVGGAAFAGDYSDHAKPTAQAPAPADADAQVPADEGIDVTAPTPAPSNTAATVDEAGPVTVEVVTNGPVPDTPANRARYGGPMSHAGKLTAPRGN